MATETLNSESEGGVYLLNHIRVEPPNDEDVKFIGVFKSKRTAHNAIRRLRKKTGFSEYPEGFHLEFHFFDHVGWSEGFIPTGKRKRRPPGTAVS